MFTYVFSGVVIPERANVHIIISPQAPVKLRLHLPKGDEMRFDVSISISDSQIAVVVKSGERIDDLKIVRNHIEYFVRSIVDAFGYTDGRGYDVEITSVVGQEDGQPWASFPVWAVFGVEVSALQQTKSERPISFDEVVPLLLELPQQNDSDPIIAKLAPQQLRRCLGDLREAIRSPHDTGFFCFRAIECIRQCFVLLEDGDDHKISWERMGKDLRISESWTKDLAPVSVLQRHGMGHYMSEKDRVQAMQRTWRVVDRFIIYAKNGFEPLSQECELLESN